MTQMDFSKDTESRVSG